MDSRTSIDITTAEGGVAVACFTSASISDVESIAAMSKHIRGYVADNELEQLIFDFEGVRFFSSQVLGLLLDVRNEVEGNGGKVVISAIDPQLHRVFKITGLDKIFEFFKDRSSALDALKSG